jgi:hypothetical protein
VSTQLFGDLFDQAEQGDVSSAIPGGTYDLACVGARPHNPDTSSIIFLTMNVLNGPQQGKDIDVSMYVPKPGDKAFASTMFGRKIRGFLSYPDVKAAGRAMDTAPDRASGFEFLASALTGKIVSADVGLRTDGAYAGTNELKATKAPETSTLGAAAAAPPQAAQPLAQQPVAQQPIVQQAPPQVAQQVAQAAPYVPAQQPIAAGNGGAQVPF